VAVLGSVLASSYGSAIEPALREMPLEVAQAARDSIGATSTIAAQLGPQGQGLLDAARPAFIQGMGEALLVGLVAAALGAVLVLLFLPARGREEAPVRQGIVEAEAARTRAQRRSDGGHRDPQV
jgi:DHA2 family integral membrane protein (MFS transporter)